MTWVDAAVIAGILLSGLLAFMRGFVGEVLGLGAWLGALVLAIWAEPSVRPFFARWLGSHPGMDILAAYAAVFIGALVVLRVIAHLLSLTVRRSALGGLNRTLGLLFGLARGAVLVVAAYIFAGWVLGGPQSWPRPVRNALALGPTYRGAAWVAAQLPPGYQPRVYPPPDPVAPAGALFRAAPHGRATQPAPARH